MARIPLRSYNREIENLIDRGQIEEAIAHSKNILKQYPRHVETYRLLGKAFLESQRYSEALDILQRVLSVIPDDFVAQLGMSIIREDENNMDAAIWHMERAYEVQPFNRAVQDELRRLYGRRDGAEPPRIRLTRGSLVRMYARGELYPQAIAETRAALAEDPQRLDLSILLARLYYLSGQKVEAAEIASSLITKLPYCVEANRILMEILPETSRADEARSFQRKVYDLDPYIEFITPHTPTSAQVAEQTVMVEHFDWQPSMQENQAPDWARNIGLQWEEKKEDDLPDWLNTVGTANTALSIQEDSGKTDSNELVPDFMKDAGWSVATTGETSGSSFTEEEPNPTETLATADIPEWLQSMAPQPMPGEKEQDTEQLDWLNQILPPAQTGNETTPAEQPGEEPSFDWLTDDSSNPSDGEEASPLSDSATVTPTAETQSSVGDLSDDVPDWLKEMKAPETPKPESPGETLLGVVAAAGGAAWVLNQPSKEPTVETPSDFKGESQTQADAISVPTIHPSETEANTSDLTPDLPIEASTVQAPEDEVSNTKQMQAAEAPEVPSWLTELGSSAQNENPTGISPATPTATTEPVITENQGPTESASSVSTSFPSAPPTAQPNLDDMDQAMAWLEALAAKQGADAVSLLISKPEERSETPPGWITEFSQESEEQPKDSSSSASPIPDDELPAWLRDDMTEEALGPEADASELPLSQTNTLGESQWIAEKDIPSDDPGLTSGSESILGDTQPVSVVRTETKETGAIATTPDIEDRSSQIAPPPIAAPEAMPKSDDMDSAMAWLEALAAKQGAQPETLTITSPQSRSETPPDWITQLSVEDVDHPDAGNSPGLPDTLSVDQLPSMEEENPSGLSLEEAIIEKDEPSGTGNPPMPDVVSGLQAPGDAETSSSIDSAMAWLEALAAKQGADPDTLKITSPDERSETPPDWVRLSSQAENPPNPAVIESDQAMSPADSTPEGVITSTDIPGVTKFDGVAPTPESDIPDWLLNYEEDQKNKPGSWDSSVPSTQVPASDESFTLWLKRNHPETTHISEQLAAPHMTTDSAGGEIPNGSLPTEAQSAAVQGDFSGAASNYSQMIQDGRDLDAVIQHLSADLDRDPVNVNLWQTLGDAYIKANKIQEALDAYTKAEELLR